MTKKATNWDAIKKDYIRGRTENDGLKHYPTYDRLAELYPPSAGTIRNKASEEKWTEQRKRYKLNVTKKVQEKKCHTPTGMDPQEEDEAANYDAETIVQSDTDFERSGENLRKLVSEWINLNLGKASFLNPYHLKMAGDALKSAQDVVKTAQGESLGKFEVDAEQRYKHTIEMLGTDKFKNQELGVLRAISKKEDIKS
jgi:hypothetical protein